MKKWRSSLLRLRLKISLLLSLLFSLESNAAPCCGGTANVPSLITGDDRAQISTTFSSSYTVAESLVDGGVRYRHNSDNESTQTLRLDAATLLSDRFQLGTTLPILRRSRSRSGNQAESTGIGDIALNLGYELLPEWSYSSWRPKGILFLTTTLPTGGSIYESSALYRVDSRGRGFYALSLGSLFLKNWGDWDLSLLGELHRAFSRTIQNDSGSLGLHPGWGASGSLSAGWNPGAFRVGVALSPSFEEPVATDGIVVGSGEKSSLWTVALQLSYLVDPTLSTSLTYSDQTLISGHNSNLNRGIALLIQKRWER